MPSPVTFVQVSQNAKIGLSSATYASQVTCPSSCPFRGNGCYAESGHVGIVTHRLNKCAVSEGYSAEDVTLMEADLVRKYARKNALPLRLHVVGDTPTTESAKALGEACDHYMDVGKAPVWTYTHNWRDIPRESFGRMSVLASCETMQDAKTAYESGYAAAVVVESHPTDGRAYVDEFTGLRVIPCPQQTREGVTCVDCGLCLNDKNLRKVQGVVAFAAHGSSKKRVLATLKVVGQ